MKADYGIDAPVVVRNLTLIGVILLIVGSTVPALSWSVYSGAALVLTSLAMVLGSKVFKLGMPEKILQGVGMKGDEQVLDVGCGRGLMLIGAAKKLTSGRAVGLDLWQSVDQSGNRPEATLQNAEAEGVRDRVRVETGDAREMPFDDQTFDLVLSSWALHNIPNSDGREEAVQEIVRVLKPGGKVAIIDISVTKEYAKTLIDAGMQDVEVSGPNFLFVIPSRTVTATKPAIGGELTP